MAGVFKLRVMLSISGAGSLMGLPQISQYFRFLFTCSCGSRQV